VKEEITRINRLVAEGKLSPEDAADLIEAIVGRSAADAPPKPPSGAENPSVAGMKESVKGLFESVEKAFKEGKDSVDWNEVAKQARETAKKGVEAVKAGIDEIGKGKFDFGIFSASATREVILPISLPEGRTLKVENPCGSVRILAGVEPFQVTAKAHFRAATHEEAKAKADLYTLMVEESDHLVHIKQPDLSGLRVDLEIMVPTGVPVDLKIDAGDSEVIDTQSSVRLSARSGDVRLKGLNGVIEASVDSGNLSIEESVSPAVTVESKSGDVYIKDVSGMINARTASGDIGIRGTAGKVVALESVSGDIAADFETPITGNVNVRTVSGTAKLSVVDGSDARVSLSTLRGDLTCALNLEDEARSDQRLTGKLLSGAGTIDVSAVTGDITLQLRDSNAS